VPSTELGPAARDVCANGFSYASADESDAITNAFPTTTYISQRGGAAQSSSSTDAPTSVAESESESAAPSVGAKRNHDGTTTTAVEETSMDVTSTGDATQVSFGNDTKKPRSTPKGGNRTGKTDAERTMIRSYLRQGVDRYTFESYGTYLSLCVKNSAVFLVVYRLH